MRLPNDGLAGVCVALMAVAVTVFSVYAVSSLILGTASFERHRAFDNCIKGHPVAECRFLLEEKHA